jgi:hypothetical protein
MKNIFLVMTMTMVNAAVCLAGDFSPKDIVGSYESSDRKAKVTVREVMTADATLFEPAQYAYSVDIEADAGACMEMYGSNRIVQLKNNELRYNGSWKPTEYLSAQASQDSDNDGSVYVSDASFKATKKSLEDGTSSYTYELAIDITHNPDSGDGGDGGESAFAQCYQETIKDWTLAKTK